VESKTPLTDAVDKQVTGLWDLGESGAALDAALDLARRLETALAAAEEAMRPILESDFGSLWAWPVTAKSTSLARLRAALAQIEELRK